MCSTFDLIKVMPVALLLGLMQPIVVDAQSVGQFDVKRFNRGTGRGMFPTFHVTEADIKPLRQVLERGTVKEDTRVLVTETPRGKLAFSLEQMAIHHIAQGETAGKPWMVTF